MEVLLVWPGTPLSTKSVYEALQLPKEIRKADEFIQILYSKDVERIKSGMFNRLEEPARKVCPSMGDVFRAMPPGSRMSGSGSSFFSLGVGALGAIPKDWKVFRASTPA